MKIVLPRTGWMMMHKKTYKLGSCDNEKTNHNYTPVGYSAVARGADSRLLGNLYKHGLTTFAREHKKGAARMIRDKPGYLRLEPNRVPRVGTER
jgi:hypothetical protein